MLSLVIMPGASDNIWEAAIAWDRQRRADPNNSTTNKETTLLFVGNKGVGKVGNMLISGHSWSQ